MKTVHVLGEGKTEVMEVEEPQAIDNKVVVKIESSLICGSERDGYLGPKPLRDNGGQNRWPRTLRTMSLIPK